MRVYWYADGHFEKATGASIFAESENSDTIEFKLPMASVDSIVHSTFLLPYPQGSEQYGNYRAESLLMHLEQDTVDGGYVWVATIPGGYLANYGTAYISARVESNDLLVVETTEQVRFEIQPGGEYQATPVLPEQGEQIEAHLATIDATLLSINGDITDLQNTKQDKVDNTLETDTKTVVGAINELNTQINETGTGIKDRLDQAESDISDIEIEQETQNSSIEANTNAINGTAQTKGLLERVADLEDTVITSETYIVTKTGSSLPTTAQLDAWVEQYAEREPQGGDYIYFTLEISGETDKNYKYTYSNVSGWSDAVELPSLESAGNDTKGIVKGSYNGGTLKLFQVNITNGEFQSINVVDNNGTLRELREYLNTNDTTLQNTKNQATENKGNIETNTNDISTLKGQMTNVLNGTTAVGKATKAAQDDNGNVITETYQTKAEGVTKQYVKDYAVPRIFNDVYFVATNGYQLEIPTTPASGIQFSTTTDAVGDFEIFLLQHTNTASYELSSKNSSQNAIFVSASVNTQVYFRMTTQVYIGNQWKNLSIELSDLKEMTAGEIYKIEFSSSFTSLGNEVVTVEDGGLIRQKFEVMTQSSTTTTFDVYSNETYPSRFNLNTQSETLIVSEAATKININGIYTPVVNFVSDPQTQINAKQEKINSSNKLDADLVDDTNSTNKFVTTGEKSTWNGKQNALSQAQLDAVNSGIDSTKVSQIQTNANDIDTIEGKIPSAASSSNQLADKEFVNSSVQTATANFRGNWGTWALVPTSVNDYPEDYAGSKTPTVNDYLVVQDASGYTGQTLTGTWRFKYSGTWATNGKNGWLPEYQVNETPLTAAQLAALNSGANSTNIGQIAQNTSDINANAQAISNLNTGKVDKVSTANKVYGTDGSGNQTTYDMGNSANNVAKYDANGKLQSVTPTASTDVANKDYVDTANALKQDKFAEITENANLWELETGTYLAPNLIYIAFKTGGTLGDSIPMVGMFNVVNNISNSSGRAFLLSTIFYATSEPNGVSGEHNYLRFDTTPTENSIHPVTSGGVYDALALKQDKIDDSWTAATKNTTYVDTNGGCYYKKVGKLVVVRFSDTVFKATNQPNDATIFSGLPNAVGSWNIFNVTCFGGTHRTVRYQIIGGSIKNYWSAFKPSTDQKWSCVFVYTTDE